MSDETVREGIREALVRTTIPARAEGTSLDEQDREILRKYGTGKITYEEMMSFFKEKAARLESQIKRPQ